MHRRTFFSSLGALWGVQPCCADPWTLRTVTVSRLDDRHEAFPDVVRTRDGTLLAIYRESDMHEAKSYSSIVIRRSRDEGATWGDREVLISEKRKNGVILEYNCPRIGQLKDGRLYVVCDRIAFPPGETGDFKHAKVCFWFSENNGKSWTGPKETPIFGIVPGKIVELGSGRWLLSTHYNNAERNKRIQIVHASRDQGKTWDEPAVIHNNPQYSTNEGSILELPGGGLVCYMRENSNRGWPSLKMFSNDEGRTWRGAFQTLMGGCHRPVAGFLPDGRILVTYRFNQGGARFPLPGGKNAGRAHNVFAALETVESARAEELSGQSTLIRPVAYDRSQRADTGYTGWVNLPDGRVFMITYMVDDAPLAYIRGFWFSLRDFFLG